MGFDIASAREEIPKGFDLASASPETTASFTDVLPHARTVAKELGGELLNQAKDVGKSFVRGASMGTAFKEEEPQPKMFSREWRKKWAEKPGNQLAEMAGAAIPIVASEGIAGTLGAGAYGTQAATGMIYGGANAAANQKPVSEGFQDVALNGLAFPAVKGIGDALGYLRKVVGEKASEVLANWFTNTKPSVALERVRSGKPSVGKEFMDAKDIKGENLLTFQGQEDTLKRVTNESAILKDQIDGRINALSGEETPIVTTTSEIKPDVLGSPSRTGGELPSAIMTSRGPALSIKHISDNDIFNNVMDDLIPVYSKYEDKSQLALLQKARLGGFLNLEEANDLRRILDSEVGNAHLKQMNDLPNRTGAMTKISNSIRSWIHKTDPVLSDLFDKQHLMLTVKDGLQRAQADTLSANTGGIFPGIYKRLAGSRFDAGMARGLNNVLGTPFHRTNTAAKYATLGATKKFSDSLRGKE